MELSFGQKMDDNGLVMPWLTHGALDAIKSMDLIDKDLWMWGSGLGDAWLAKRCKFLSVVERNDAWLFKSQEICQLNGVENIFYLYRPCNEGSGQDKMYCEIPASVRPDVFIVDDAYRYECILKALEFKPCTLIVDNYQQDYVFICPAAVEALKEYDSKIFIQHDHRDHEGNPWQTAIFYIK